MISCKLGFRAATSSWGRFAAFIIVGFVACACALVVAIAPAVKAREGERDQRIERLNGGPPTKLGPRATFAPHRGRTITLVQIPGGVSGTLVPPGLEGPLPPGTVRLSPALGEAIDEDPVLARWFPYDELPELPVEAVSSAGEMKAYIGVERAQLERFAAGQPDVVGDDFDPEFGYFQWSGFLAFVGVPAAGLMVLAARFGLQSRRHRYAALRLLGMPSSRCRFVLAIETGLPCALGAAIATAVAATVQPHHVVVPIVERWVFGSDARLGAGPLAIAAGSVCVFGSVLGALAGDRRLATGRLEAVAARAHLTGPWISLVYVAGLALLVWAWLVAQPRDPRRFAGVILVGLGAPGAVAHLAALAARALHWRNAPVVWFLAVRKLAADPRSLSRLAGIVAVVMFAVGIATPFSQTVTEPNSTWAAEARDSGTTTVMGRSRSLAVAPLVLRGAAPPGTRVALKIVGLWRPGQPAKQGPRQEALVASCADLESLVGQSLPTCNGQIQHLYEWQEPYEGTPSPRRSEVRGLDGQPLLAVPVPTSAIDVPVETQIPLPDLLVPRAAIPPTADAFVTDVALRTEATDEAWEANQAWVTGSSAFHLLDNEFDSRSVNDTTNNWIVLAFAVAAAIATFGAILSSLDDQRSMRDWSPLRALGVGTSGLIAIRLIIGAIVAAVAIIVATVPAIVLTSAFLRVNDDPLESAWPFVLGASVGAAAVLAVTLGSAIVQMRRLARRADT